MIYRVVFNELSDSHLLKIQKSGDKASLKKLYKILDELAIHPTTGTGNPEPLKHSLSGFWSRRINQDYRLVYEIDEVNNRIIIHSLKGNLSNEFEKSTY